MTVQPIAYSYWRRIAAGARTFKATPANVKDDVRYLAKLDVQNGTITRDQYESLIGEAYPEEAVGENSEPAEE